MINFSVKPSSYTGASDTNGGGYVDGYDATYANFCTANGGPTFVGVFSELYQNSGEYTIELTSGSGSGVYFVAGQIAYVYHGSYGFWYGRVLENYPGAIRLQYLPMANQTGYLSEASIANLITNNIDAGEITVGGALATIEAACELALNGDGIVLKEDGAYAPSAIIDNIEDLTVVCVDSTGAYICGTGEVDFSSSADNHGFKYKTGAAYDFKLVGGTYRLKTSSGADTSLLKSDDVSANYFLLRNLKVIATTRNQTYALLGIKTDYSSTKGAISDCIVDNIYAVSYSSRSATIKITNSYIDCTIVFASYLARTNFFFLSNNVIKTNIFAEQTYLNVIDETANYYVNNCTFINNGGTDYFNDAGSGLCNTLYRNCIFVGYAAKMIVSGTPQRNFYNCAFYNCSYLGDTVNDDWQGNTVLSESPFVESGDYSLYYRLDPAGPDFAKLYDATTGRVLIGATGPELTTGTGGTGVCNLIGNGGMIE